MNSKNIQPTIVENQDQLEDVVNGLQLHERYAIDTEFHREKTYYPRLALVQIRWGNNIALIDPVVVNIDVLAPIFRADKIAIFHAGSQDLEILLREVGEIPTQIFDTQIAAGFHASFLLIPNFVLIKFEMKSIKPPSLLYSVKPAFAYKDLILTP